MIPCRASGALNCRFFEKRRGGLRLSSYTLAAMLKKILFVVRLAIVFAGIVLFGRAVEYLILNGGFNGAFYDIIFFRS